MLYSCIIVAEYSQDFVCLTQRKKNLLILYRQRMDVFKNKPTIVEDCFKYVLNDAAQLDVLLSLITCALYLWMIDIDS